MKWKSGGIEVEGVGDAPGGTPSLCHWIHLINKEHVYGLGGGSDKM